MTYIDFAPHTRLTDPVAVQLDPLGLGVVCALPPGATQNVGAWSSANWCVYQRLIAGGTISKIRVRFGVASGNVCVAVYAGTGVGVAAAPGGRLATSGSVAIAGVGEQDVSLGGSYTVYPGMWVGIAVDNTTATVARGNNQTLTGTLYAGTSAYQSSAFPCPALAAPTAYAVIGSPIFIGVP